MIGFTSVFISSYTVQICREFLPGAARLIHPVSHLFYPRQDIIHGQNDSLVLQPGIWVTLWNPSCTSWKWMFLFVVWFLQFATHVQMKRTIRNNIIYHILQISTVSSLAMERAKEDIPDLRLVDVGPAACFLCVSMVVPTQAFFSWVSTWIPKVDWKLILKMPWLKCFPWNDFKRMMLERTTTWRMLESKQIQLKKNGKGELIHLYW